MPLKFNMKTNNLTKRWFKSLKSYLINIYIYIYIHTSSEHVKRCSISYLIREIEINTARYHYIPIRTEKIQNTISTRCWWGCRIIGILTHCWWKCKKIQSLCKTIWQFLTKLSIFLPCNLAIMLCGIYLKELKTYIHTKTCPWRLAVIV